MDRYKYARNDIKEEQMEVALSRFCPQGMNLRKATEAITYVWRNEPIHEARFVGREGYSFEALFEALDPLYRPVLQALLDNPLYPLYLNVDGFTDYSVLDAITDRLMAMPAEEILSMKGVSNLLGRLTDLYSQVPDRATGTPRLYRDTVSETDAVKLKALVNKLFDEKASIDARVFNQSMMFVNNATLYAFEAGHGIGLEQRSAVEIVFTDHLPAAKQYLLACLNSVKSIPMDDVPLVQSKLLFLLSGDTTCEQMDEIQTLRERLLVPYEKWNNRSSSRKDYQKINQLISDFLERNPPIKDKPWHVINDDYSL
ncbi:hypothetical protein ACMXYX_18055 (plasmid) [Neptuniibacter sp. QD72_48]|uniref:hypothetical protein n=1 Tax=Neptuniibacter sp. QD72_48 TaxID=3398214 RepID=UPI0039F53E7A